MIPYVVASVSITSASFLDDHNLSLPQETYLNPSREEKYNLRWTTVNNELKQNLIHSYKNEVQVYTWKNLATHTIQIVHIN